MKSNRRNTLEGDLEVVMIIDEHKPTNYRAFGLRHQEPKYRVSPLKVAKL